MSNQKIVMDRTQKHVKNKNTTNKFDLELKVQGRILIMDGRDTSSYGDTSMCQICQTKKKVMGWTRICTDTQTDRVISIYPPELRSRGV